MLLIENPEFSTMRGTWNQVLDSLLRRMVSEGHSQGSVTLKLNIQMGYTAVETAEGGRMATVPNFDYKVTSNMPQTYSYKEDMRMGEVEIEYDEDNGGIRLRRLPNTQMTLSDYERDKDS